jgi:flavorubredoxin
VYQTSELIQFTLTTVHIPSWHVICIRDIQRSKIYKLFVLISKEKECIMKKVLIAYSSRTGITQKMADYLAEGFRMSDNQVEAVKNFHDPG